MLFSSIEFIFRFLPVFMLIYLLVPEKYRNIVLLSGSLVFYGVGEPYYVLLLIFSIIVNYAAGLLILSNNRKSRKSLKKAKNPKNDKSVSLKTAEEYKWYSKYVLSLALLFDFGILFVYKYWDFIAENINKLSTADIMPVLSIGLPLGISFYTFQMASFLFDCYRGKIKGSTSIVEFSTYVSMFPQLVMGPIIKYEEVEGELKWRKSTYKNIEDGLKLFSIGLGFKVLLANQIGTLWTTLMTAGAGSLSLPAAWMGAFAYSFEIYFDFWGYSLMAKGLGEMLGFNLPDNFDNPYASKSLSAFWRRWHITLGRWFKEYLYIPLGGNRKGFVRTIFNLLIVWTLTGIWHGANYNFALWGLTFFLLLSIEKCGIGKWLEQRKVLGHIYVIILIPITWMIFAISDMNKLVLYLQNMAGIHTEGVIVGSEQVMRYLKEYGLLFIVCIIFSIPGTMSFCRKHKDKWYGILAIVAVFWFSVYEIMKGNNNPFLYFGF
ncbi:MAG: MBOAT family protein [Butyrivibrio sp.]|nr:MBOAT family protein [Butyrivibrio sp.]